MLFRRFRDYILHGRTRPMAAAFALGIVPVIGLLGSVIAAFVTLRKSINDGALVFIATALPTLLIMANHANDASPISPINVVVMVVAINFFTWLCAVILRQTSSWSLVLDMLGLLGFFGVLLLHIVYPDLAQFWAQWLLNYMAAMKQTIGSAADSVNAITNINVVKHYITGQAVLVIASTALLLLLAARWWQGAAVNPGGLRKELLQIRLSKIAALSTVAGLVLSIMHVEMAQDAMPIMLMFFSFAGLSLLHYLVLAKNKSWGWLTGVYVAFLVVPFVFIGAGLLDTVFDYRKRIPAKSLLS